MSLSIYHLQIVMFIFVNYITTAGFLQFNFLDSQRTTHEQFALQFPRKSWKVHISLSRDK